MSAPLSPAREGRWALVTGGSSGIGRSFAFDLARRGFDVFLVGRNVERLSSTAAELSRRHHVEAHFARIDLAEPTAAETLLDAVGDREIGVFIVVAGKGSPGEFVDAPLQDYLECVNVKIRNNLVLLHSIAKRMKERGAGAIAMVSSTGALQGVPSLSNNAATEAYLLSLSEALHHELKPHGVRVTGLMPGPTVTPGLLAMVSEEDVPRGAMTPEATSAEGLRALESGKRTHIAGASSRAMLHLLPRAARIALFDRMLGRLFAASASTSAEAGSGQRT